jgi:hypothetical protein
MGIFRSVLERKAVKFTTSATQTFSGTVYTGTGVATNVNFPEDAVQSSVHIAWGNIFTTNDLALKLTDVNGNILGSSNHLNAPGLTGKREQITINTPPTETLQAVVSHTGGIGTAQNFFGAVFSTRAQFADLSDMQNLSFENQYAIKENLRSFMMLAEGKRFRSFAAVSRRELAATLLRGGRVPQYVAASPIYSDVTDFTTRNVVESAQKSPNGKLFFDAGNNGTFRPDAPVTKIVAAVALVKAANLQSLAQTTVLPLSITDYSQIPAEWRGYVAIALQKGFLSLEGNNFAPSRNLNRVELAQAMVKLSRLAIE